MVEVAALRSQVKPTWCPGCGDYGVLNSLLKATSDLRIASEDLLVVSGIGCSSNLPGFMQSYGFHGLHGRAVPVASGAKLANHELHVIIAGGDGDGYGIGLGHFIHAMRRNLDVTYLVMNNEIYGLTTGQASPTSAKGHATKSTPHGNLEIPINPVGLAVLSGATYVARGFSGEPDHLTRLIRDGIQHKGFSLVDIQSPCVTYNKHNTYQWFKERVYKLEEETGYEVTNREAALQRSLEWGEKIPIGLFYKAERPTYEEEDVALKNGPLVRQPLGLTPEQSQSLVQEFL